MLPLTGAAKGAMDMLTKVMALELGPHKVSPAGVPPLTQPVYHIADPCLSQHRSG